MSRNWCTNRTSSVLMSLLKRPMGHPSLWLIVREQRSSICQCALTTMVPVTQAVLWQLRSGGLRREFKGATCGTNKTKDESMRAETQNLVEEIKQSVTLLRRHL